MHYLNTYFPFGSSTARMRFTQMSHASSLTAKDLTTSFNICVPQLRNLQQ
jgi:hypothetical protein